MKREGVRRAGHVRCRVVRNGVEMMHRRRQSEGTRVPIRMNGFRSQPGPQDGDTGVTRKRGDRGLACVSDGPRKCSNSQSKT